ncbi:hypothetical protein NXX71_10235 [Bacteroides faecis]|nr:hypothetical protein [Bacteroides faecis]
MALNKSTGNMYAFVSHTYNPLKGECEHSCAYCFMRRKLFLPPLHLELKELKVNLGEGNFIFVGSSTDEWAANVPSECVHPSRRILVVTHDTTLLSPEPIANELRMLKAKLEKSTKLRLRRMLCVG